MDTPKGRPQVAGTGVTIPLNDTFLMCPGEPQEFSKPGREVQTRDRFSPERGESDQRLESPAAPLRRFVRAHAGQVRT